MRTAISLILIVCLGLSGCAGMTPTEQRTLSGGALGAAGGALIGAMAGNAGLGAAIGGVVGATGGYIYSKQQEAEEDAYLRGRQDGYWDARKPVRKAPNY